MAITVKSGGGENVTPQVDRQAELLELLYDIIDKLANPPAITAENGEVEFVNIDHTETEDSGITLADTEITDDGNGNVTIKY